MKTERRKVKRRGRAPARLEVLPALSEKQSKCLEFIFNFYRERRHFPTHREIAQAMGSSATTAAMYIDPLVEKGYLTRVAEKGRNIRITVDGLERLRLQGVSM